MLMAELNLCENDPFLPSNISIRLNLSCTILQKRVFYALNCPNFLNNFKLTNTVLPPETEVLGEVIELEKKTNYKLSSKSFPMISVKS